MERPNRKQWVVLWSGVIWTVGSLVIAGDYLVRALLAGLVVTAVLFWQLSGSRDENRQPLNTAPPILPPSSDPNVEALQPPPTEASTPVESNHPTLVTSAAQQKPGPSGVGGWLVIVLLGPLLTPFLTVYTVSLYGEIWTDPWFFTLAISGGILAGWSLFVALALLNRWPNAPTLAKAQFVISTVFWTGLVILAAITAGLDFSKSVPTLVGSWLGTMLWVSYLNQSRRVKATYGPLPPGPIRSSQARLIGLAAGILVSFLAVLTADSRRQVWAGFHSDNGRYEVEAPGTARESLENGVTIEAFGNDVRGFVVSSTVLTPENTDAHSYFESVQNSVITNLKGSTIKTSSIHLDGHPGIEFVATFPWNGGVTGDLRGRIYRTNSEGFLLLVTGPQGGRTASEADRFFRSFQIKP
jgi:hypothetical protein